MSSRIISCICGMAMSLLLMLTITATGQAVQTEAVSPEEDGLAEVNGTELYYNIMGEGEPIVVLHGGPGMDHNHLVPHVGKLADEFRVIFYDQRGMGNSSAKIDSAGISTANYVRDLEEFRKFLGLEKLNLMGFSWGSMLAMQYAITHPDRVNRLILGGPMGGDSGFVQEFVDNQRARWTRQDSLDLAAVTETEGYRQGKEEALDRAARINFRTHFHNKKLAERITLNYGPNTRKNSSLVSPLITGEYYDYDIHEDLKEVGAPTLILHGRQDPIPWTYAEKLHQALPNSELKLMEEVGHWIFLEGEERFLNHVRAFMESGN